MFLSKILVAYSVTEKVTGRLYLVDTEAEVSVRPPLPSDRKTRYFQSLGKQHVENNLWHTFHCTVFRSTTNLSMVFRYSRCRETHYSCRFLRNFNIVVDMRNSRLLETHAQLRVQGLVSHTSSPYPTLLAKKPSNVSEAVQTEYPGVLQQVTSEQEISLSITHHIKTSGTPVFARHTD